MVPNTVGQNGSDQEDEDPRVKEIRRMVEQMSKAEHRIQFDPTEDDAFLKDIRERVKSITVSTPTLQAQDTAEKAEAAAEVDPCTAQEVADGSCAARQATDLATRFRDPAFPIGGGTNLIFCDGVSCAAPNQCKL